MPKQLAKSTTRSPRDTAARTVTCDPGWVERPEINILGAVAGLDIRHPAIKVPGIGRIGLSAARRPSGFGRAEAETS